jgi:hypothetical protein
VIQLALLLLLYQSPLAGADTTPCGNAPLAGELRPVLEAPFTDTADALGRLQNTSRILLAHRDRRALFATTYVFTITEYRRMLAEGRFRNGSAFEHLTAVFANLYRAALWNDVRGAGDANPEAWRIAFGNSGRADVSPPLLLLLSVNAHITHDLPLALLASGEELGSREQRADYDAFNEAFRVAVSESWDVLDRFGAAHGELARGLEGHMALSLVYRKRADAWSDAAYLAALPAEREPEGREWLEEKSRDLANEYLGWRLVVR